MAIWVGSPASYTPGRNRSIQYVVIHSTEGSEGPTSAEAGAAYDKRRTDGTSTHLFTDSDTAVREVRDEDRAHHARFHGNEIGIGVEICGLAGQSDAQWHDPVSAATLAITAREVAALCTAHNIPVRRLSVAEVRAAYYAAADQRPKGICGHVDVTNAYPEDSGTHTDPGPHFPWTEFLQMVRDEQGDDMPLTADDIAKVAAATKKLILSDGGVQNALARIEAMVAMRDPVPVAAQPNLMAQAIRAMAADAKEAATQANLNGAALTNMDGKLSALVAAEATEGDGSAHTHTIDLVLSADLTGRAVGSTGPAQPLDAP